MDSVGVIVCVIYGRIFYYLSSFVREATDADADIAVAVAVAVAIAIAIAIDYCCRRTVNFVTKY